MGIDKSTVVVKQFSKVSSQASFLACAMAPFGVALRKLRELYSLEKELLGKKSTMNEHMKTPPVSTVASGYPSQKWTL